MNSTVENKLSKLFKKIELALSTKAKLAIGLGVVALAGLTVNALTQNNDPTVSSVMITNVAGNHGGTGVILDSNASGSKILTNSHVCRVVEQGGLVTGKAGSFLVTSYKHSELHDICLITVSGNMNAKTKVASRAPVPYYEKATISGHPALMPNVVTSGHFSGRKVIEVMIGVKKCTDEDLQDPAKAFFCGLAGGLPEVKRYESTLVTATIMPGSSGSGVYNEDGELSGLAFAGSGNLGYAWTVPFEMLRAFLDEEEGTIAKSKPSSLVDLFQDQSANKTVEFDEAMVVKKLRVACSTEDARNKYAQVCNLVSMDTTYIQ